MAVRPTPRVRVWALMVADVWSFSGSSHLTGIGAISAGSIHQRARERDGEGTAAGQNRAVELTRVGSASDVSARSSSRDGGRCFRGHAAAPVPVGGGCECSG